MIPDENKVLQLQGNAGQARVPTCYSWKNYRLHLKALSRAAGFNLRLYVVQVDRVNVDTRDLLAFDQLPGHSVRQF